MQNDNQPTSNITEQYASLEFTRGSNGYNHRLKWLVDDAIPIDSFGVIFGASETYKSFQAIDLACSIATDAQWNDHTVDTGVVCFIAGEGSHGIAQRIKAWEIVNDQDASDVFVLGHSLFPAEEPAQEALIGAIKQIEEQHNKKVKLVVFDTLARCFTGDENTARDMNAFITGCDQIRTQASTAILCIHHSGKDGAKGARGSSVLRAACDYEFQVTRKGNSKLICFENTKQKDSARLEALTIEMDIVDLGVTDSKQRSITSLAKSKIITCTAPIKNSPTDPIVQILEGKFSGQATRGEVRKEQYGENLTAAQRQSFSRSLKASLRDGNIAVEPKKDKANDDDIIKLI